MLASKSADYISNRAWLRNVVGDKRVILRNVSALEFLQYFAGYDNENEIDVYAQEQGEYENVNYSIVDTFDKIDYIKIGNVMCCSLSQVVNDMLSDFENIDEAALVEALSKYYYENNNTFDGLYVAPANALLFEAVKEQSRMFYCEG